ncbi:MAG: hypothetical protein IJ512_02400 [Ruminococcus sp.]|nr:hypothetical protein [Ruminococcus sp.]
MNLDEEMKKLEGQVKSEEDSRKAKKKARAEAAAAAAPPKKSNPLLEFVVGFILLGAGIYWVLNSFVVTFSWGSLWGSFGISAGLATGLMLIPLFIGIGLAFFMEKKLIPGLVIGLGVLIILVTLLTSVRFRPMTASLWQYVVMFGMIAAGAGLLAKSLFKKSE